MNKYTTWLAPWLLVGTAAVMISACSNEADSTAATEAPASPASPATTAPAWQLLWRDEFDGTALNDDNWTIETGDGAQYGIAGWGNNELEWYSADNIRVSDGNLVLSARQQPSNGYAYTSGRLRSDHKVDVKYGRIEARIKAPLGQGLWSAFWMLPTDSQYGAWASGGEIDIMEVLNLGTSDDLTYGTLHYGMAWPLNVSAGGNASLSPADGYHVYAVEWQQDEIRWYIDDLHYATVNAEHWWSYYYAGLAQGYVSVPGAPFNQDFHLLLNLAVGGDWPGSPNADTVFDADMLVDYVRVYQCDSGLESGAGCASNINASVQSPAPATVFSASYPLFDDDGVAALGWGSGEQRVTRQLSAAVAWDNGGISVNEQSVAGVHARVLDINTSDRGNVAISASDGKALQLFGMGNNPAWWQLAAGELKFDLYIDSAVTPNDSSITIKMDSGYPKLGFKQLSVADLPKDSWSTVSIPINDLLQNPGEQPLDTSAVMNLMVIEFSAAAHVQLDNIVLRCGHKDPDGCGISAPALVSGAISIFRDNLDSNWSLWDCCGGAVFSEVSDDSEHGNSAEFSFNSTPTVAGIAATTPVNLSTLLNGRLSFDMKILAMPDDAGADWQLKLESANAATAWQDSLSHSNEGVAPVPGSWQHYSFDLAKLSAQGLDLSQLKLLMIFPDWGKAAGAVYRLDNVEISAQ